MVVGRLAITYFRRLLVVEVMFASRLTGRRRLHVEFNASLFTTTTYYCAAGDGIYSVKASFGGNIVADQFW